MKIVYDKGFSNKFNDIWQYIAKDSKNNANKFKKELKFDIENIPHFPYKYRESIWFNDKNIRDLIFKGYTVPYLIQADKIVILDIFKWTRN